MHDVFFISYDEPLAEQNWQRLLTFAPFARRISGVKGIRAAHQQAATLSNTASFFVVDGDAWLLDDWDFTSEFFDDIKLPFAGRTVDECVLVWQSLNPYNGLTYGYGGLKLLPKKAMLRANTGVDVTTSIADCFMPLEWTACETRFAGSPLHAWRGAFRECAKLSSSIISNENTQTKAWLDVWTSKAQGEYAEHILAGANQGKVYGLENAHDAKQMAMINDYAWMEKRYEESFQQ